MSTLFWVAMGWSLTWLAIGVFWLIRDYREKHPACPYCGKRSPEREMRHVCFNGDWIGWYHDGCWERQLQTLLPPWLEESPGYRRVPKEWTLGSQEVLR